jgi:hypothetical protein
MRGSRTTRNLWIFAIIIPVVTMILPMITPWEGLSVSLGGAEIPLVMLYFTVSRVLWLFFVCQCAGQTKYCGLYRMCL